MYTLYSAYMQQFTIKTVIIIRSTFNKRTKIRHYWNIHKRSTNNDNESMNDNYKKIPVANVASSKHQF